MSEGRVNYISSNTPSHLWIEICERPNKWKLILNRVEQYYGGLNLGHFETTCSGAILNHRLTQKLKLMGEGRFNFISSNALGYRLPYLTIA